MRDIRELTVGKAPTWAFLVAQWPRACLPTQETQATRVRSLGQEDPLGRKWQPLQYSCLGSPTDGEAQQAAVHGATKESHSLETEQQQQRSSVNR